MMTEEERVPSRMLMASRHWISDWMFFLNLKINGVGYFQLEAVGSF